MVDYNRTSNGSVLPTPVAREIIENARQASLVMQNAQRKTLTDGAHAVTISNGVSGSKFVEESARKPVGTASWSEKVLRAKKIALVLSFSTEFMRDKRALYQALVNDMPRDLAYTFDRAVLFGVGAPTSDEFDTLEDIAAVDFTTDPYAGALSALSTVAAAGGSVTNWTVDTSGEIALLGARDSDGNPILTAGIQSGTVGGVLGRPVVRHGNVGDPGDAEADPTVPPTIGFAVDWDAMYWGTVEGIKYREYDGPIYDASGDLLHAGAQDNMGSVICEIEAGFRALDTDRAVRLTDGAPEEAGG